MRSFLLQPVNYLACMFYVLFVFVFVFLFWFVRHILDEDDDDNDSMSTVCLKNGHLFIF